MVFINFNQIFIVTIYIMVIISFSTSEMNENNYHPVGKYDYKIFNYIVIKLLINIRSIIW